MAKMCVLIIGASGFVGKYVAEELMNQGHEVRGTYFRGKTLPDAKGTINFKGYYLNSLFLNDESYLQSMVEGVDIILDCTSVDLKNWLELCNKLISYNNKVQFFLLGNGLKQVNTANVYVLNSSPIIGLNSKFTSEVVENSKSKIVLSPVPSLAAGYPIHIHDFASIVCKFFDYILDNEAAMLNLPRELYIKGEQKITIRFMLETIAKVYGEKILGSFHLGKLSNSANKFLFEHADKGFSEDSWQIMSNYDKKYEGPNLADLVDYKCLSLSSRLTNN